MNNLRAPVIGVLYPPKGSVLIPKMIQSAYRSAELLSTYMSLLEEFPEFAEGEKAMGDNYFQIGFFKDIYIDGFVEFNGNKVSGLSTERYIFEAQKRLRKRDVYFKELEQRFNSLDNGFEELEKSTGAPPGACNYKDMLNNMGQPIKEFRRSLKNGSISTYGLIEVNMIIKNAMLLEKYLALLKSNSHFQRGEMRLSSHYSENGAFPDIRLGQPIIRNGLTIQPTTTEYYIIKSEKRLKEKISP
jgi:hypothetical protein